MMSKAAEDADRLGPPSPTDPKHPHLPASHPLNKKPHRKTKRRRKAALPLCNDLDYKCEKVFASQRALDRHLARHVSHRFVCFDCTRRFTQRSSLDKHRKDQHGYDAAKRTRDVRERTADDTPNMQLPQSDLTYVVNNTEDVLTSAVSIKDANKETESRLLRCSQCGDEFFDAQSLADHVAREGSEHGSKRCVYTSSFIR